VKESTFEGLILGQCNPDRWKLGWFRPPSHWIVKVTDAEEGTKPSVGEKLRLPKAKCFNYGSFLGDRVIVTVKADGSHSAKTFQHGFQPTSTIGDAARALEELCIFHQATMTASRTPLSEVAGRSIYAAFLLRTIIGYLTHQKEYPDAPLAVPLQCKAITLVAEIFTKLGIKNIRAVSKLGCSHASGCEDLVSKMALKPGEFGMIQAAKFSFNFLFSYLPSRPANRADLDSIRGMLALAAEAERNYGQGTRDLVLGKLSSMGNR
jgi:hypothetical protein